MGCSARPASCGAAKEKPPGACGTGRSEIENRCGLRQREVDRAFAAVTAVFDVESHFLIIA